MSHYEADRVFWNEFAPEYIQAQEASQLPFVTDIIGYLNQIHILPGRVLDIGGGAGRFAIPMAKKGSKVCMVDISDKMLDYVKKQNVLNLSLEQKTWPEIASETHDQYDVVFSSMLPSLHPTELVQYNKLARRNAVLVRQIKKSESVFDQLDQMFDNYVPYSPQNDLTIMAGFQDQLAKLGLEFTVKNFHYERFEKLTKDDAVWDAFGEDLDAHQLERFHHQLDKWFTAQTVLYNHQVDEFQVLTWSTNGVRS